MEKIRLVNGNTYNIEDGAMENLFSMFFASLSEPIPVIEDFTEENLAAVEFMVDDVVCGKYENKHLHHTSGYEVMETAEDGTETSAGWRVVFVLADVDMVAKRLAALEESQAVQDEAIVELAAIVAE